MNIAVLVGKEAAGGRAAHQAARLATMLRGHKVHSVAGWGGEEIGGTVHQAPAVQTGYVASLHAAVDTLHGQDPAFYLLLGGDGLASYVAGRLVQAGAVRPKILGLAGGTANVGPIIALTLDELEDLPLHQISFVCCDALEARDGERFLALGFNDLVVGNTLLSTMDGQVLTIDALRLAQEGVKASAVPVSNISKALRVTKNGKEVPCGLASPAQAVLSTLQHDNTYGRAVLGALCMAAGERHMAALVLLDIPVVSFEKRPEGDTAFMTASQLLFKSGDMLCLSGLSPGVCLVADGNPFPLENGSLRVRIMEDAVMVLEKRKKE
jgi:hypothetical protein